MKSKMMIVAGFAVVACSTNVLAADFEDQAEVLSVAPNMVASPPTCVTEAAPAPSQAAQGRSPLGMVAGAALGGLLGHQVGKGSGKTVSTIGGAVAGALLGDTVANREAQAQAPAAPPPQQRCTPNPPHQEGWLTTYKYKGRTFTEVTQWMGQPGQAFGVWVHIDPNKSYQAPTNR